MVARERCKLPLPRGFCFTAYLIRWYHHVESCQETVPQAIIAFLESTSFEDALRTAVSLGGDSDTLAAITGSIAEAFYGVPEELRQECRKRLTPELAEILIEW